MNEALFKTFRSPYQVLSLKSSRYRMVVHYFIFALVALPVVFLPMRSFSLYMISEIIIFLLFPLFLWAYLNTEEVTDIKLDTIKVVVISTGYFAYLMAVSLLMTKIFNPVFRNEYMVVKLGYICLLAILTTIITMLFFYRRYAQKKIRAYKDYEPSLLKKIKRKKS